MCGVEHHPAAPGFNYSISMTQPRVPEASDFPQDLVVTIIPPQDETKPVSNILILLHGLGDTHIPFAGLGKNFNFPETACLAIRGPSTLPFSENGFHWGDDVIFDSSTGSLDMEAQFTKTHELLKTIIDDTLLGKCGWKRRAIFFLGFGQGGMVALDFVSRLPAGVADGEYGGVVSLGGPLPYDAPSPGQKAKTLVMLMGAEKNSAITDGVEARVKNVFEFVEVVKWRGRNEDGMVRNAEEAMPMMRFFARRLGSRAGIPEGAVEL
ncbi:Phospholipase/Carboxylesterase-domain-containing protein [Trichophaea hybrida]|nr:Phospholipase/Carboxylesterase-domain-containing protein [Trichophaea hybrida]